MFSRDTLCARDLLQAFITSTTKCLLSPGELVLILQMGRLRADTTVYNVHKWCLKEPGFSQEEILMWDVGKARAMIQIQLSLPILDRWLCLGYIFLWMPSPLPLWWSRGYLGPSHLAAPCPRISPTFTGQNSGNMELALQNRGWVGPSVSYKDPVKGTVILCHLDPSQS